MRNINRITHKGPFILYRLRNLKEGKNFLDISLRCCDGQSWGWGWGTDNTNKQYSYNIRLGWFDVFAFEKFKKGFELRLLGFWCIR